MVDFTLSDEQKDIRQLAHDFAEKEIRPVAWELDKDSTFPDEIIKQAWELGLMNNHIPEEYGGPASTTSPVVSSRRSSAGAAPASAPR